MTILVQPLTRTNISNFIFGMYGPVLSQREAEVFDYCQSMGEVYTGYIDGELVCCWGLMPPSFLSNQAYLWMWAPQKIQHQFLFIRHSQIQVDKMLRRYGSVVGHCKVDNRAAQRWLKWLGAKFEMPVDDLMPFVIEREPAYG